MSRFEELRNKLGLSRREIHEATGISKNTLLLYEKGATPSIPQIEKIAKTYNVNPAWLAGWSDDDRQPQTVEKVIEKIVYVKEFEKRFYVGEVDGEKVDIGFVGEIKEINTEVIKLLESNDTIPVISSIGVDKNGQTYNINADYVAGAIAGKLQADRLIFLTDVDGILLDYNNKQTLIDEIDVEKVNDLIERGIISGGMLPKVTTCLNAIENGVENVVILNGKLEHSVILELFTVEGAGTLIKKDANLED